MSSNIERFGVFLPSYIWEGDGTERAKGIIEFAKRVEDLGFDSVFITDHLLAAKRFYAVSFLEPLAALALVAGATQRIKLGTSILILPLRNPVMLAKQTATLQFLSQNRLILGVGVGWFPPEFEAVGVSKSDRGRRADEILDIMLPAWEGDTVTYKGDFYEVEDVYVEPLPSHPPKLWVGGGSQLADDPRRTCRGSRRPSRPGSCAARGGSRVRRALRTTSHATGTSCRLTSRTTARTRLTGPSRTRTSCTS
jgi:probable F420-dependent oxidoreductase